jgi:hypothetical protein
MFMGIISTLPLLRAIFRHLRQFIIYHKAGDESREAFRSILKEALPPGYRETSDGQGSRPANRSRKLTDPLVYEPTVYTAPPKSWLGRMSSLRSGYTNLSGTTYDDDNYSTYSARPQSHRQESGSYPLLARTQSPEQDISLAPHGWRRPTGSQDII